MIGFMGFDIIDLGLLLAVSVALLAGFVYGLYPRTYRCDIPFLLTAADKRRETLIVVAAGGFAICVTILNFLLLGVLNVFWIVALILGFAYLTVELVYLIQDLANQVSPNGTLMAIIDFICDFFRYW